MSTTCFYADLEARVLPLEALFADEAHFVPVPADWVVLLVDVENSTQAVRHGMQREINRVAVSCISLVLGQLYRDAPTLRVPYFFGGDGATFLLPPAYVDSVRGALDQYRQYVWRARYLSLKLGTAPVSDAYAQERHLQIAKWACGPQLTIPVVLGKGLKYLERRIKSFFVDETRTPLRVPAPRLDDIQRLWHKVYPAQRDRRLVCLVVGANYEINQRVVFRALAQRLTQLFGPLEARHPADAKRVPAPSALALLRRDLRTQLHRFRWWQYTREQLLRLWAPYFLRFTARGRDYRQRVSLAAYAHLLDGGFNCMLSGTEAQIDELVAYLDRQEAADRLRYGLRRTPAARLTFYLHDPHSGPLYLIDGINGDYTAAAKIFKQKVARGR